MFKGRLKLWQALQTKISVAMLRSATRNTNVFERPKRNHWITTLEVRTRSGKANSVLERSHSGKARSVLAILAGKARSIEYLTPRNPRTFRIFKRCVQSASQTKSDVKSAGLLTPWFLRKSWNTEPKVKCGSKNFRCQNLTVMASFRREMCQQVRKNGFGPKNWFSGENQRFWKWLIPLIRDWQKVIRKRGLKLA